MHKNVLLYGNSILLNGLAARMQAQADLAVTRQPAQSKLAALSGVDAVIVDVNEMSLAEVLVTLQRHNDIRIIGVDDRSGTATVLSRQIFQAHTLDDVGNCL